MRTILTFDIGTTSVKTCLFDQDLHCIGRANEEYRLWTGSGNLVELDPEVYWNAVVSGARKAGENAGLRTLESVAAVCVTTQGETLIPVDREGRPLRRAIVWLDARASEEGRTLSALKETEGLYERTGVANIDGMTPLSKILWIKDHEPGIYAATHKFLLLEDYILFRLCGRFVSEKVLMSTTGYYDIRSDVYLTDLLQAAGLDVSKFPDVLDSGVEAGRPTPQAAAELGISESAAIITGAMDQVAAAIGGGSIVEGTVTETTGTTLVLITASDERCFYNCQRINIYRHVLPNRYYIIPFCITAGMVLKWFKDEFCQEQIAQAAQTGRDVYDILSELVQSCESGADGLIAVPYFNGMLQPEVIPDARGIFFGASLNTGKAHFVRAIFEGVGYMLRENLELLEQIGVPVQEIRSFGGGSRSAVWQQIKADICHRRIGTMAETECASLGAAALAAVCLGWKRTLEEAVSVNEMRCLYIPDPDKNALYDRQYARYRALFERTKDLF